MNGAGWVYLRFIRGFLQLRFPDDERAEMQQYRIDTATRLVWEACAMVTSRDGGFMGYVHTPQGVPVRYA